MWNLTHFKILKKSCFPCLFIKLDFIKYKTSLNQLIKNYSIFFPKLYEAKMKAKFIWKLKSWLDRKSEKLQSSELPKKLGEKGKIFLGEFCWRGGSFIGLPKGWKLYGTSGTPLITYYSQIDWKNIIKSPYPLFSSRQIQAIY